LAGKLSYRCWGKFEQRGWPTSLCSHVNRLVESEHTVALQEAVDAAGDLVEGGRGDGERAALLLCAAGVGDVGDEDEAGRLDRFN
jgi:hypothetical protein